MTKRRARKRPLFKARPRRQENPKPISEEKRKELEAQFARDAIRRAGPVLKEKGRVKYQSGMTDKAFDPGKGLLS